MSSGCVRVRILLCGLAVALGGCGGDAFTTVELTPKTASQAAMVKLDRNQDGKLDRDELKAAPGLELALDRVDTDSDAAVSAEELTSRLAAYASQSDLIALVVLVTHRGKQVSGAEITIAPEPFMGDGYVVFSGTTDSRGECNPTATGGSFPGLPLGFYTVRICHGDHGESLFGLEVAEDLPSPNRCQFEL